MEIEKFLIINKDFLVKYCVSSLKQLPLHIKLKYFSNEKAVVYSVTELCCIISESYFFVFTYKTSVVR